MRLRRLCNILLLTVAVNFMINVFILVPYTSWGQHGIFLINCITSGIIYLATLEYWSEGHEQS